MTPREAAELLGCSVSHVRTLLRTNKLRYTKVPDKNNNTGYVYSISRSAVNKLLSNPNPTRGWPRGKKRGVSPKIKVSEDKLMTEVIRAVEKECSPDIVVKLYRLLRKGIAPKPLAAKSKKLKTRPTETP